MDELYTIVFADGTKVDVSLNGNNYISPTKIDDTILSDENLDGMTINGVEQFGLTCCNHFQDEEGDHIIFRELSPDEKHRKLTESNITNIEVALAEVYELIAGGI